MLAWLKRILFPSWISRKLEALRDARSPDFLEKYYEEMDEDKNARER